MKTNRPLSAVFVDDTKRGTPLAIHPDAVGVSYNTKAADETCEIVDGVAVLCIEGPLEHKGCGFWQDYESLADDFKSLCDDASIRCIVLKFDSPGGEVSGLYETVSIMQDMKAKAGKPVIGYVDEACYSAAYALACVCDEIYLPESGGVGSVGVITAMTDMTEAAKKAGMRIEVIASGSKKADGHPYVPLTEGAIKRTQKTVDRLAASFFGIVSDATGLSVDAIQGLNAGIYMGQEAVDVGLANGVMSIQDCLTLCSQQFTGFKSPKNAAQKKEVEPMAGILAAAKAIKDAEQKLSAAHAELREASTDGARALAAARVLAAEDLVAKITKTKTVTKDTHEEEHDDGMGDEEDEKAEEKPVESSGELPEAEDEEEDSDESASAFAPSAYTERALLALAQDITGHKSIDKVMGALKGMQQGSKKTSKLAAEVAALKADNERQKITALVSAGMKAGKILPAQKSWAQSQSPAALQAYLDATPKGVHTASEQFEEKRVEGAHAVGVVTPEMARIWKKQGHAEADFPKLLGLLNERMNTNGAH